MIIIIINVIYEQLIKVKTSVDISFSERVLSVHRPLFFCETVEILRILP